MANSPIDKSSLSLSVSSATTLMGFCITALALLLTLHSSLANTEAFSWAIVILVVAIVFLLISIEFYSVAAWPGITERMYLSFVLEGSGSYILGVGWVLIAIGFMFLALVDNGLFPYLPPGLSFAGFLILYVAREYSFRKEPTVEKEISHPIIRYTLRALLFAQLIAGIVVISLVQRGVI